MKKLKTIYAMFFLIILRTAYGQGKPTAIKQKHHQLVKVEAQPVKITKAKKSEMLIKNNKGLRKEDTKTVKELKTRAKNFEKIRRRYKTQEQLKKG